MQKLLWVNEAGNCMFFAFKRHKWSFAFLDFLDLDVNEAIIFFTASLNKKFSLLFIYMFIMWHSSQFRE